MRQELKIAPTDAAILIVDDHLEMTRLVRRLLQGLGLRKVQEAHDAKVALELLRQSRHRLVLMDWHMNPTSGEELARVVQKDPAYGAPSIIIMSGSNTPAVIAAVRQLNVSGYLLKPFSGATLKTKLASTLGCW